MELLVYRTRIEKLLAEGYFPTNEYLKQILLHLKSITSMINNTVDHFGSYLYCDFPDIAFDIEQIITEELNLSKVERRQEAIHFKSADPYKSGRTEDEFFKIVDEIEALWENEAGAKKKICQNMIIIINRTLDHYEQYIQIAKDQIER